MCSSDLAGTAGRKARMPTTTKLQDKSGTEETWSRSMDNNDDDDTLIYDSTLDKTALWQELVKLRVRVDELEEYIDQLRRNQYFGEK